MKYCHLEILSEENMQELEYLGNLMGFQYFQLRFKTPIIGCK